MSRTLLVAHRGYQANFDLEGEPPFYGKIIGIKDLIMCEADSIDGCFVLGREAVDDYIESCTELGVEPNTMEATS